MQPNNYILQGADPVAQIEAGMAAGLQRQAARQGMGLAADQNARAEDANARAQELQPIAVEQAAANVDSTRLNQDATRQAIEAKQAAQQRTEAFRTAIGGLGPDATFEDYNAVSTQFPEFAAGINETWGGLSDGRKAGVANRLAQIGAAIKTGNLELAEKLAIEYADAAENSGDAASAATARAMAGIVQTSPDAAMASLGLTLSTVDPDLAKTVLGTGTKVQQGNPIGDGTVYSMIGRDGKTYIKDAITDEILTGDAARQRVKEAMQSEADAKGDIEAAKTTEKNKAEAETVGAVKQAEGMGSLQVKFVENATKAISSIESTITNLKRVTAAADDGAVTGLWGRWLPAISAATAEYQNARGSLGLDVIGSVAFGALSEGELALAMDIGSPGNLSGAELRAWVNERIDALEKVNAATKEQAAFLSKSGNTLEDWIEKVHGVGSDTGFDPTTHGLKSSATEADLERVRKIGAAVNSGTPLSAEDRAFIESVTP